MTDSVPLMRQLIYSILREHDVYKDITQKHKKIILVFNVFLIMDTKLNCASCFSSRKKLISHLADCNPEQIDELLSDEERPVRDVDFMSFSRKGCTHNIPTNLG